MKQELPGDMPTFLPGDIVKTKIGKIGVITDAIGGNLHWNDLQRISEFRSDGQYPRYCIQSIPRFPKPEYSAWWESKDWSEVIEGPLHTVLGRGNSNAAPLTWTPLVS